MEIKELQAKLLAIRDGMTKLSFEANNIVKSLQGCCDHSKTDSYRWEHDNGYGRQHWRTGKICVFCGWKDIWDDGRFRDDYNA